MERHFVQFFSPGTLVAETTTLDIDSWDIEKALEMASAVKERYEATPYGFRFLTRSRNDDDLDSKVSAKSPMYYLPHCKVETLDEVKARNDPSERILRSNMENNGYSRIVTTTEGWSWTMPLGEEDIVLTK